MAMPDVRFSRACVAAVLAALAAGACAPTSDQTANSGTGGFSAGAGGNGSGGATVTSTGGVVAIQTGGSGQTGGATISGGQTGGAVGTGGVTDPGTGGAPPTLDAGIGVSTGGVGTGAAGAQGFGGGAKDPGTEGDGDFTVGPNYSDAADSRSSNVAKGTIQKFTMPSSASAIYPVDVQTNQTFTRQVQVYIPAGYVANTEVPFIIAQDGARHQGQLIPVLDNMIASKKLPKMVAILIEPGPGDGTGSERSNEYDKVSDKYSMFVETEVLPKIEANYKIKFTKNPEGRAAFGGSSGGPAAFGMAWFRPDLYRRIVTFSGSFVNLARDATYPNGAWDYHQTLIPGAAPKPIRVAISCGQNDNSSTASEASHRNWVIANQNMAKALKAKGYHYHFTYGMNSGHDDDKLIKQVLPDIMAWLWRGYVAP